MDFYIPPAQYFIFYIVVTQCKFSGSVLASEVDKGPRDGKGLGEVIEGDGCREGNFSQSKISQVVGPTFHNPKP